MVKSLMSIKDVIWVEVQPSEHRVTGIEARTDSF